GLLDQGADGAIALLHVAAEFGGGDRDGGHDSPNPVTVPCTAVVVVPSGQRSRTPGSAVRTPQVADSAGPAGATAVPGRSAVSTAKPGKQVSHSATEAPAGRGTRAMSMSAPTPAASASIPVVPASPAMETSLAAAGAVRATKRPSSRSSSPVRQEVESHCRPVYPGRQPPPRSAVSRSSSPTTPPPPRTGRSVRPSAVTDNAAGTPSWVCPPSTGTRQASAARARPRSTLVRTEWFG